MKMKKTVLTLVVLLLSAMAFADWIDGKPIGKWFEGDGDDRVWYIFKHDAKNDIQIALEKDVDDSPTILQLLVVFNKRATCIGLNKPSHTLMPYDERLDMANKFVAIVNKHIKKDYSSFVEAMKKESQQLLLETAVIKPGYKTVNRYTYTSVSTPHLDAWGHVTPYTDFKTVGTGSVAEQVRDPSQDMHVRPYKIILDTSRTTDTMEIFDYHGQL